MPAIGRRSGLADAAEAMAVATAALERARGMRFAAAEAAEKARAAVNAAVADLAAAQARHAALEAQHRALATPLGGSAAEWTAAAIGRGGRALAAGLQVTTRLRTAVEAALGAAVQAIVVDRADVLALREGQGHLALRLGPGRPTGRRRRSSKRPVRRAADR